MRKIIFDTSSPYLYAAFSEDDEVIYERFLYGQNRHSENLLKEIAAGLENTGLKLQDFHRVCFGIGPGSYTGLRISATVGKTLGWALDIPVYTASSLDMLLSGHVGADGIYAVTLRAKKGYIYGKVIQIADGAAITLIQEVFMEEDAFFNKIKKYKYMLVSEDNYLINPLFIPFSPVDDLHNLAPNYLRGGL